MDRKNKMWQIVGRVLSYVLVAVVAAFSALYIAFGSMGMGISKLEQLQALIEQRFIGQADAQRMQDAAAAAMVGSLGDQWSYYISADDYVQYEQQMKNIYVGIGVTIEKDKQTNELTVKQLEPGGSAKQAGMLIGDVIVRIDGQDTTALGISGAAELVRGQEGTKVLLTVRRGGEELDFELTRTTMQLDVAKAVMLDGNIGYIKIYNFDERCAQETLAAVEKMKSEGAKALVFDVRNNPGGYKNELVKVLDALLPEGELFRSVDYTGREEVDMSDEKCLKLPMAVLVNESSYSAAEFFAAALEEYDWAVTVGERTVGKGYFQNTFLLKDGSAVGLSIGKYFTPKGVSLAEVGGLTPNIVCEVDEETAAKIYAELLSEQDDPQIQAAVRALTEKMD